MASQLDSEHVFSPKVQSSVDVPVCAKGRAARRGRTSASPSVQRDARLRKEMLGRAANGKAETATVSVEGIVQTASETASKDTNTEDTERTRERGQGAQGDEANDDAVRTQG